MRGGIEATLKSTYLLGLLLLLPRYTAYHCFIICLYYCTALSRTYQHHIHCTRLTLLLFILGRPSAMTCLFTGLSLTHCIITKKLQEFCRGKFSERIYLHCNLQPGSKREQKHNAKIQIFTWKSNLRKTTGRGEKIHYL